MMSPRRMSDERESASTRYTPLQIVHIIGNLLRIWSVYSMYQYLTDTGASVLLFIFSCLIPSSLIFLVLQKPWKGRSLSNQQVVPSIINGAITALYFTLWGKSLKSCGPLRTILMEYSGAILGVLSAALYGRRNHLLKKICGLAAMLASFYFLSLGWATASHFPISFKENERVYQSQKVLRVRELFLPIVAGILSTLRRVIARRVSLKNQLKRRLNAITITSATCFLFPMAIWDAILGSSSESNSRLPFSAWVFLSYISFGIVLIFYVDSIAEERLHMVFSSPRHLMVSGGCIIVMEIAYVMDFSLLGFLLCSLILGVGIYVATSVERGKESLNRSDPVISILEEDQMHSLPT